MKFYTLVLDRSGSMNKIWDTITNVVNEHIEKKSKNALCSLLLFDDNGLDYVYKYENNSPLLDKNIHRPRGNTPLRDAIIYGVETLVKDFKDFLWQEFVEVEFTIFTDGEENCSKFWKSEDVARTIAHFEDSYNWKFSFIGNGSAGEVGKYAKEYGIKTENTINYQKEEDLVAAFAQV
jgi:hypothetical protein